MADLLSELERFEQEMKELGSEPSSSTLAPLPHLPQTSLTTPPPSLLSPFRRAADLSVAMARPSMGSSIDLVGASGTPISSTPVHSMPAKPLSTSSNPISSTPTSSGPSPGLPSPGMPMPWLKNGAQLSAAPATTAVSASPSLTIASSSQFTFLRGNSPYPATVSTAHPQALSRSMPVSSPVNFYARAPSQPSPAQPQQYQQYHNQQQFQLPQPQQLPMQPTAAQAPQYHYQGLYQSTPEMYHHPQQQQAQQLFQKDAQTITPEALEHVKAALASGDGEQKFEAKRKAVPRKAAGQTWEDPTLADWPENDYRLFCGDLGNEVNDEVLTKAFTRFPTFNMARVVRDKRTGKTKGFGFVSFASPSDLASALKEMNGKYVGNRPIKLRKSTWKERTDFEAFEKQKTGKKPKMSKKNVLHK